MSEERNNEAQTLRRGVRLGKYRLEKRLGEGGFARVFRAYDQVEGIRVALKIFEGRVDDERLEAFRQEVRVTAKLDHPNVLRLKDASVVSGKLLVAYALGRESLGDRLRRRLSTKLALGYASQLLAGLAHAHERRVLHGDVKPDNLILFDRHGEERLCLADFGLARYAYRTLRGSGSGTVGYIAPEQAMGSPSLRSDVFSAALVIYRMLSGHLPKWPFTQPLAGLSHVRERGGEELAMLLSRCLELDTRKRPRDAGALLAAFDKAVRGRSPGRSRRATARAASKRAESKSAKRDWRRLRFKQFVLRFGRDLELRSECGHCGGPLAESMEGCPWCGTGLRHDPEATRYPIVCPSCSRGLKLDWEYCPWCREGPFEVSGRRYSDRHYVGRCAGDSCDQQLMRFMKCCPRCRRSVDRKWNLPGERSRCGRCGGGVARDYWDYCPWCVRELPRS